MKCTNPSCGKEFQIPLILYNGESYCPHCRSQIDTIGKLSLTVENEDAFILSEIYYYRFLSPSSYKPPKDGIFRISQEKLLDGAISECRRSAKAGNPFAIRKMAFYREFFMDNQTGTADRIRHAFREYAAVYRATDITVPKDANVRRISAERWERMRAEAIRGMMRLLTQYPEILEETEDISAESLRAEFPAVIGDFSAIPSKKQSINSRPFFIQTLKKCFAKDRAPLFGIFVLPTSELEEIFFGSDENEKKPPALNLQRFISRGVELRYLIADKDGGLPRDNVYFSRFANDIQAKKVILEAEENSKIFLFFFNRRGKHALLSKKQIQQTYKDFCAEDFLLLHTLVSASEKNCVFYDDDIAMFRRGHSASGSVEKLIDHICGEIS